MFPGAKGCQEAFRSPQILDKKSPKPELIFSRNGMKEYSFRFDPFNKMAERADYKNK